MTYQPNEYRVHWQVDGRSATERKIASFADLQDGWHYGAGGPMARETVDAAIRIVRKYNSLGFSRTDAFPGRDREILVTAYVGEHYIGVVAEPNGRYSINHERAGAEEFYVESGEIRDVLAWLNKIASHIWPTSVSRTRESLITTSGGSVILSSRNPRAAVCQSSSESARKLQVA